MTFVFFTQFVNLAEIDFYFAFFIIIYFLSIFYLHNQLYNLFNTNNFPHKSKQLFLQKPYFFLCKVKSIIC